MSAICALPSGTTRLLGSTQVLTSSCSVVKELVDNALDSQCTSVSVEVASNSLDLIQVRDNGSGIAEKDRSLVARRYCTSKIRTYADLQDAGGKYLGFRGEALSSCAEVSASMMINTRVEGESAGTTLHISRKGEVDGRSIASHPVGTTVRITGLFDPVPVRKQTALKCANKSLVSMKKLLQAYALARPSVRFSLRVLKTANDKVNWTYAPSALASIDDAAMKVVGKDCASQCKTVNLDSEGFKLEAFIPRHDADPGKISSIGHFLSIDSRPLSTGAGTLKRIVSIFKEKLQAACSCSDRVNDPFFCLRIECPPRSYDPSIEPAKNDLLFDNEENVIRIAHLLFEQCYPTTKSPNAQPQTFGTEAEEINSNLHYTNSIEDCGICIDEPDSTIPPTQRRKNVDAHQSASGKLLAPWTTRSSLANSPVTSLNSRAAGTPVPLQERQNMAVNSATPLQRRRSTHDLSYCLPTPENSSPLKQSGRIDGTRSVWDEVLPPPVSFGRRGSRTVDNEFEDGEQEFEPVKRSWPRRTKKWTAINDIESIIEPEGSSSDTGPSHPGAQIRVPRPQPTLRRKQAGTRRVNAAKTPRGSAQLPSAVNDEHRVWFDHLAPAAQAPTARSRGIRKRSAAKDMDIRDACGAGLTIRKQRQPLRDPAPLVELQNTQVAGLAATTSNEDDDGVAGQSEQYHCTPAFDLPLEQIPPGHEVTHITCEINAGAEILADATTTSDALEMMHELSPWDMPTPVPGTEGVVRMESTLLQPPVHKWEAIRWCAMLAGLLGTEAEKLDVETGIMRNICESLVTSAG